MATPGFSDETPDVEFYHSYNSRTETEPPPSREPLWKDDEKSDVTGDEDRAITISALKDRDYTDAVKKIVAGGDSNIVLSLLLSAGRSLEDPLRQLAKENNAAGVKAILQVMQPDTGDLSVIHAFNGAADKNAVQALAVLAPFIPMSALGEAVQIAGEKGSTDALRFIINRGRSMTSDTSYIATENRRFFNEKLQKAYNKAIQSGYKQTAAVALRELSGQPLKPR